MINPLLKDYDKDPFPNPDPVTFHGIWTEWPELHNQKSLKADKKYLLKLKGPVPEGGLPFFVEQTHPSDGGDARLCLGTALARLFRGTCLLRTMWDWEHKFEAVPV